MQSEFLHRRHQRVLCFICAFCSMVCPSWLINNVLALFLKNVLKCRTRSKICISSTLLMRTYIILNLFLSLSLPFHLSFFLPLPTVFLCFLSFSFPSLFSPYFFLPSPSLFFLSSLHSPLPTPTLSFSLCWRVDPDPSHAECGLHHH